MTIEIEAKMRLQDLASIESRLEEVGGARLEHLLEINTYFDTDQRRLKSTDRGLRIRVEQVQNQPPRVTITHKGPRAHGKLKSRSETEAAVADARAAVRLLEALDYLPVLTFEKRRRRWRLDECLVELDTLPYLGSFIEIEGPSDEAVLAVRDKLGLAETPLIRASYIAMLMTYLSENHLQISTVRFEDSKRTNGAAGGK